MNRAKLDTVLDIMVHFGKEYQEILAIGLCGSWARGEAHEDSDIDLVFVVQDQHTFKSTDWIKELNFSQMNDQIAFYKDQEYGRVWSRHVFLKSGIEIEFSFTDESWADINNLDSGTKKVVSDGYKILYDPTFILDGLVNKVLDIQESHDH